MAKKSVKNKPLSFRERGFKIAQLLFDNPVEFKSDGKAKKCVVGYPCSSTCISTNKNCRNKLNPNGESYNFAKWVTTHLSLGGNLSKEQMGKADSLYNQKLSGLKPKETPATQPATTPTEDNRSDRRKQIGEHLGKALTDSQSNKSATKTLEQLDSENKARLAKAVNLPPSDNVTLVWRDYTRDPKGEEKILDMSQRHPNKGDKPTPEELDNQFRKAIMLGKGAGANNIENVFIKKPDGSIHKPTMRGFEGMPVSPERIKEATQQTETKPAETKPQENPETKALQEKKNKAVAEAQKEYDTIQARHDDLQAIQKRLGQTLNRTKPTLLPGQPITYSPEYTKAFNESQTVSKELGSLTRPGTVIHSLEAAKQKLSALQQRPLEAFGEGKKPIASYGEADLRKPLNDAEKKQLAEITNGTFTDARKHFSLNTNYKDPSNIAEINSRRVVDNFVQSEANKKYGLSQQEAAAIYAYTANGYVGMSAATRMQFKDDSSEVAKASILASRAMNEALEKLPSYKEAGKEYATTYRGTRLPKEIIDSYSVPGQIVTLKGFTSTTTNSKSTEDYLASTKEKNISETEKQALSNFGLSTKDKTKKGDFDNLAKEFGLKEGVASSTDVPIKYTIQSKNGKKLPLSAKPSDSEVIFASNSKFEVLESKYNKDKGYHEVSLREV